MPHVRLQVRLQRLVAAVLFAALSLWSRPAAAEVLERTGVFEGQSVTYRVVLPTGYDPARTYPAVLVFAGGPQTLAGATRIVENDWRAEAERRGYIVVSPASPDGRLFYEGAEEIIPAFLEQLRHDYRIENTLTIAGASNGGISAFQIATRYPQAFHAVIGYPGMLDRSAMPRAFLLRTMCTFLHVGDRDAWWVANMQAQAKALETRGVRVTLTIEKNQNHGLKAAEINLSNRLFDEIESCRR